MRLAIVAQAVDDLVVAVDGFSSDFVLEDMHGAIEAIDNCFAMLAEEAPDTVQHEFGRLP